MSNEQKLKIEFAPGAFDEFDGTQEELDELINQIQEKFASMTPEQIAEQSRDLTDEDIEELFAENPDLAQRLLSVFDDEVDSNRKLQ